jgi:hypothetical protein
MNYPAEYHRASAALIRDAHAPNHRALVAAAVKAMRRTQGRARARAAHKQLAFVNPGFLHRTR